MSKELKALANLMARVSCGEDNIVKAKYDYATIEKALKVLEIIVEKKVNLGILTQCKDVEMYNKCVHFLDSRLEKQEFDLVKEVLL